MYDADALPLIAVAALWGAVTGLLVPRAAYRLAVEPDQAWRAACPGGHLFTGPVRGWLGTARCAQCAAVVGAPTTSVRDPAGAPPDSPAPPDRSAPPDSPAPPDRSALRDRSTPPAPPAPHDRPALPAPPAPPAPYARTLRPPLVTALACALLAAAAGARPELVVWLLLAPFGVLLAVVDLRVHRLPDVLTLPLAAATAALLGLAALLPGGGGSWPAALLGGVALGGGYFLLFLINPNGMGFGDVKLAVALGTALGWYGWPVFFAGAFAGFLLGAVYGVGLVILRRAGRRTAIPFGPFMITGALAGLLLGGLAASAV